MILLSAALLAGYMPARKASRIYPMTAVRGTSKLGRAGGTAHTGRDSVERVSIGRVQPFLKANSQAEFNRAVLGAVRSGVLVVHDSKRGRRVDIGGRIVRYEVIENVDELE